MDRPFFKTEVSGKIVLAGEHAVIRGARAVTVPHPTFKLSLFADAGSEWSVDPIDANLHEFLTFTKESFCRALGIEPHLWQPLVVRIQSSIPQGAGAGSSAALCVAMMRLWMYLARNETAAKNFDLEQQHLLATEWENRFHGKSSGMDVAAVMHGVPIEFRKGAVPRPLKSGSKRGLNLRVHDTGLRSSTRDCVVKVQQWIANDPERGLAVDQEMDRAALSASQAIESDDIPALALAMHSAQKCFESWGLMPESANALKKDLEQQGALAVKMTGSGQGGFLVSLWSQ